MSAPLVRVGDEYYCWTCRKIIPELYRGWMWLCPECGDKERAEYERTKDIPSTKTGLPLESHNPDWLGKDGGTYTDHDLMLRVDACHYEPPHRLPRGIF